VDTIKSTLPRWQVLHRVAEIAQAKLNEKPLSFERFVFEVQPFKLNERLAVQQGVFLCPLSVNIPFMDSLAATFNLPPSVFADAKIEGFDPLGHIKKMLKEVAVVKLLLPCAIHHDILQDLWNMNVNAATLFPGLDGLARSLNYHLRIAYLWDIKYDSVGFKPSAASEIPQERK
jgi:hypothetical protein